MRERAAAIGIVLALALGACGDDSGGGEVGRTQPTVSNGSAEEGSGDQDRGTATGKSDEPQLQLDEKQEPVPKGAVPPAERSGTPPRYARPKQLSKEQLKAVERPVYEQSRYLCRRLGIDGMRREYRIDSSDPDVVLSAFLGWAIRRRRMRRRAT